MEKEWDLMGKWDLLIRINSQGSVHISLVDDTEGEPADTSIEDRMLHVLHDHNSPIWPQFMAVIANGSPDPVSWSNASLALDVTRKYLSGVLGANTRRIEKAYGGWMPFEKKTLGSETYFQMTPEIAKIVKEMTADVESPA